MKKVFMDRTYDGQAYREQVAIDENGDLFYRATRPGVSDYGEWGDESEAIEFIFGDMYITRSLVNELRWCANNSKSLSDE